MKPVITVIEPEGPKEWFSPLQGDFDVRFYYPKGVPSKDKVTEILENSYGVIITSATEITDSQMDNAVNLRIIAKCGGPPSNISVSHAESCGIALTCVPGANTTTIAEYTVMLIIAMLRHFDEHTAVVRHGQWRSADTLLGHDLKDSAVGIVGLGSIGREVVKRLRPFGCRIFVYTPHPSLFEGCTYVDSLEELLPLCDAVTLHCRVTPQTQNLLNASNICLMKKGAVLVNTARGVLVDEKALADALKNGPLSAAAVDVFQQEPPQEDNPLMMSPHAVLTPHASGWTHEALKRECSGAVNSILAYYHNETIPGLLTSDYKQYLRV